MTTESAQRLRGALEVLGQHPAFDLLSRQLDDHCPGWSWSTQVQNYALGDIITIDIIWGADMAQKLVVVDAKMNH